MLPYFANFIFVVGLMAAAYRAKTKGVTFFLLAVASTSMVLLAGFRDVVVGTDTVNYVALFDSNYGLDLLKDLPYEYGFSLFVWAIRSFSDEYAWYFLISAAIVVGCFNVSLLKACRNYPSAYFVLLAAGFYTYSFNTARQGIALAIFSMSIRFIVERNFIKYLLLVLMASFFHVSALVALPLYFVALPNKIWVRNGLLVGLFVLLVVFGEFILSRTFALSEKYEVYADSTASGGYISFAFTFCLAVVFLFFKRAIKDYKIEYEIYLNIFLFGIAISSALLILNQHPSGVLRLGVYFSLLQVFLVPIIFLNLPKTNSGYTLRCGFLLVYLAYFYLSTNAFGALVPYETNGLVNIF